MALWFLIAMSSLHKSLFAHLSLTECNDDKHPRWIVLLRTIVCENLSIVICVAYLQINLVLQFPNAVVLNAVGHRNTQMRENECKRAQTQKSAKGRKRAQKSASA